jgi:hypothetical protein
MRSIASKTLSHNSARQFQDILVDIIENSGFTCDKTAALLSLF